METEEQHGGTRTKFADTWSAIPKVVLSTALGEVQGNARLAEASMDEEAATLKAQPGRDISVGGWPRA